MSFKAPSPVYHCNRYSAQTACEHCEGIIRDESWCITVDPEVYYAYQIVANTAAITVGDSLILHSLGVTWTQNGCQRNCETR